MGRYGITSLEGPVESYNNTGFRVSGIGDINGDGFEDVAITARRGTDANYNQPGSVYIVFGSEEPPLSQNLSDLDGTNGFVIQADSDLSYNYYSNFGSSITGLGDVNGDGVDDFAIVQDSTETGYGGGYYGYYGGYVSKGVAYVVYGGQFDADTPGQTEVTDLDHFRIDAEGQITSVVGVGDVDGDDINDIAINSAEFDGSGGGYTIYFYDENANGVYDDGEYSYANPNGYGQVYNVTGYVIYGTDQERTNNDPVADQGNSTVVLNAGLVDGTDGFSVDAGQTIGSGFYGGIAESAAFSSGVGQFNSDQRYDVGIVGGADIDGDGFDDVLVTRGDAYVGNSYRYRQPGQDGYYGYSGYGGAFVSAYASQVIDGSTVGGSATESGDSSISGFFAVEEGNSAALGDVSGGDGFEELAFTDFRLSGGSPDLASEGVSRASGVFVANGSATRLDSTTFDTSLTGTSNAFYFSGRTAIPDGPSIFSVTGVLGVGDVTGDGLDDFLIVGNEFNGGINVTAAYLVAGSSDVRSGLINLDTLVSDGEAYYLVGDPGSAFESFSIAAAGDVNNDGADDLIIGNANSENGNGLAEIIYGGAHLEAMDQSDGSNDNIAFLANGEVDVDTGLLPIRVEIQSFRSLAEGSGGGTTNFEITLIRSGNLNAEVSVDYEVPVGGYTFSLPDATADDFDGGVLPSGTITFGEGEASATIVIPVVADNDVENSEDFRVVISNPVTDTADPISIENDTANAQIVNDDFPVRFRVNDPQILEGDSGETTDVTILVSRFGNTAVAASVDYTVQEYFVPTSSVDDDDIVGTLPMTGTLNFAANETSREITVQVIGDDIAENDEFIQVVLTNPAASDGSAAEVTDSNGFVRVVNDDAPVIFSSFSTSVVEDDGATLTFTINRTGETDVAATVDYELAEYFDLNRRAEASDFSDPFPTSGTLSFAAGETQKTLSLTIVDDDVFEGNELVELLLSNAQSSTDSGAQINTPRVFGTIIDDEVPVYYRVGNGAVTEGEEGETTTMNVVVTRSGDTTAAGSVDYQVVPYRYGSSADSDDFVGSLPITGTVSFAANQTSRTIQIEIAGDNVFEGTEYFEVQLSNAQSADPDAQVVISDGLGIGFIYDDDSPVYFRASGSTVFEGDPGDTRELTFTVTRFGDTSVAADVDYDIAGGTANAADFDSAFPTSGTLNFAANETSKVITLAIDEDNDIESDEYTYITLSNPSTTAPGVDAFVSGGVASATIRTDDFPAIISTNYSASAIEGDTGDNNVLTFVVNRTGDTSTTVNMDWNFATDSINPLSSDDFTGGLPQNGSLTFLPGETSKNVSFTIAGDGEVENNERGVFSISNVSSSAPFQVQRSVSYGTVVNDDTPPQILINMNGNPYSTSVLEGNGGVNAVEVEFVREGDSTGTLDLTYNLESLTSGLRGASSFDIQGTLPDLGNVIRFGNGETSKKINILVNGDTLIETNESLIVRITDLDSSADIPYAVPRSTATLTIINDDGRPPTPELPIDDDGDGIPDRTIPVEADVFGDPHIVTLDGLGYDFQAVGEYVLVETEAGATNPFSIQVRFEAFPNSDLVSVTTRMAVEVKGKTVEVDATNPDAPLLIDGVPVDPEAFELGAVDLDDDEGNGQDIFIEDGKIIIVLNEANEQVAVGIMDGSLNVCMFLGDPAQGGNAGAVRGLMGNANQDLSDDFGLRDGSEIPEEVLSFDGDTPSLTFDFLYGRGEWDGNGYRDSWQIDASEALFTGDTPDYPENFPAGPLKIDDLPQDIREAAEQAALDASLDPNDVAVFEAAVLDFALTGMGAFLTGATQLAAEPLAATAPVDAPELTPTVNVTADATSVTEGDAGVQTVEFTFYRLGDSTGSLEVSYEIGGDVDAADLGDDTPLTGVVTFADGEDTQTLEVLVKGDLSTEDDEVLRVSITGTDLDGVQVGGSQGETTILTDDFGPEAEDDQFDGFGGETIFGNVFEANSDVADSDADDDTLSISKIIDSDGTEYPAGEVEIELPSGVLLIMEEDGNFSADTSEAFGGLEIGQVADVTFEYEVTDGNGGVDRAMVTLTIQGTADVNERPDAVDDMFSTDEDTRVTGDLFADNDNGPDNDPDGDALTITNVELSNGQVRAANGGLIILPSGAHLRVNSDGTFTYDPFGFAIGTTGENDSIFDELGEGENGTETFRYAISDGNGGADTATVTIDVSGINDAPVAIIDEYQLTEDESVSGNALTDGVIGSPDFDPEGDDFEITAINGTSLADADEDGTQAGTQITVGVGGMLTIFANGDFTFDTAGAYEDLGDDFAGSGHIISRLQSVNYTITDTGGLSDSAALRFSVQGVNDAPDAEDDEANTAFETSVDIDVLTNDSDAEGDDLTVTGASSDQGDVQINADNTLTFTPDEGFSGDAIISYTVEDTAGGSSGATVTVAVAEPDNTAPVAADDDFTVDEDVPTLIDFLANDEDPEGDRLAVTILDGPSNGMLALTGDGWVYTSNLNYNGPDSFTYEISDGEFMDEATVQIDVNPVNDDPEANDDRFTVTAGQTLFMSAAELLANDTDIEGDTLTLFSSTGTANGEGRIIGASLAGFTYTADDFIGETSFTYTISDGNGGFDTATVFLTVEEAPNTPPVADDFGVEVDEDGSVGVDILANASDPDGDELEVELGEPENGTVEFDGEEFRYTPDADFNGEDSFDYTVSDGRGGEATGTVTVTVGAVNDAPELDPAGPFDVDENTTAVGMITASDIDSPGLSFSISGGADGALFEIDGTTGALSFKDAPDFETPGDDGGDNGYEVEVSVSDGEKSDAALVTVNVQDVEESVEPNPVDGTDAPFEQLTGTDGQDVIRTGGGTFDFVTGGGNADIFVFEQLDGNGRDLVNILDYEPGIDAIDLQGREVLFDYSLGNTTYLTMQGTDFDTIIVNGASSIDEITFISDDPLNLV